MSPLLEDFVYQNVKGQPRSDCVAKLRDANNIGTVFEIACLGSLITKFGKSKVIELYPKFPDGQRGEGIFEIEGRNICFEASVLTFNNEDLQLFKKAKRGKGIDVSSIRSMSSKMSHF